MQKREKEGLSVDFEAPLESSNKKIITILITAIILVVVAIFGFFIYLYLQTPEHKLSLGASIEEAKISEDGKTSYIKLAGESDKNITKIKFIFKDAEGKEYAYETSEGTKEISVPFKRSFWQWLLMKPAFEGKYDYEIKASDLELENFQSVEEVSVLFEYKTETNQTIITPPLDVEKPTQQNKTTTPSPGGGGGGGGGGTTQQPTCTNDAGCQSVGNFCDENTNIPYNCILGSDGCLDRINGEECGTEENCENGKCKKIVECTTNEDCGTGYNCVAEKCVAITTNVFYVSPNGTGFHNGSSFTNAFNLSESQKYANSHPNEEITFLLADGDYSLFKEVNERTSWVTWRALNYNKPVFSSIHIGDGTNKNYYIKFEGLNITSKLGSGKIAYVQNANYVEFLNCKMVFYDRYPDVDIIPEFYGNYLKIENCEIYAPDPIKNYTIPPTSKARGINIQGYNIEVTNNKIHDISSTGINVEGPSSMLIENNEIYNHHFCWPGYNSSQGVDCIHGNCITLMSGNIIVRNNTMHSSRDGIAVYTVLATNLTIENNVMYYTTGIDFAGNTGALGVGPNVKINNNTIVMQHDNAWEGPSGEWYGGRYGGAIQAPFDSGYDGSFELKNNVIIGRFNFNNNFISENNIVFCTGNNLSNATVFTPDCQQGKIKSYKQLEDGWNPEEDFFVEENLNFSSSYQKQDLRPLISGALCNPGINPYVKIYGPIGALPCVCTNDAQCEEVFGESYFCENEKCVKAPKTYYVSQLEACNDNGPGTSEEPWCNLSRAQNWNLGTIPTGFDPMVKEGDIVIVRNGNYESFVESTSVNSNPEYVYYRNNWVTYKADVGHTPVLNSISILNADKWPPTEHGKSYLIFEGFRILNGVSIMYTSYAKIKNCNITTNTAPYTGFYAPYFYSGGESVHINNAHYITIENNDISHAYRGIGATDNTNNIVIKNNIIHNIGEDGIVATVNNLLVENNTIFNILKYRTSVPIFGAKTGDFIQGENVTMEGTEAKGIIYRYKYEVLEVWQTTTTDFKSEWRAGRGTTIIGQTSGAILTNITNVDPAHCDCLTIQGGSNIIVRSNKMTRRYGGGEDGWGFKIDIAMNITIENNLIDTTQPVNWFGTDNCNVYNNTFYGHDGFQLYSDSSGRNTIINNMYNNIIERYVQPGDGAGYIWVENHGENIFGLGYPHPHGFGGPSYPFSFGNDELMTNVSELFVDPDNNNYRPLMSSPACNGSINPPGVAVGALPCVCTNNNQCEQVFGINYVCENEKCVLGVGGASEQSSSASLSPFTKLWNFLKSLLTAKTGNAITGNVVSENLDKDESFFVKVISWIEDSLRLQKH